MRKTSTLELVRRGTGRDPEELIRELYVDKRHSDEEIASALSRAAEWPISRAAVQQWRQGFGITRDERPAVQL